MNAKLAACQGKAIALLLAVFVAGVVSGGAGMRAWQMGQVAAAAENPEHREAVMAVDRLSADLDLTPQQVERVQVILDEYIMLEADLMAQMQALQKQGRAEILRVLDREQRSRFESMFHSVADQP